MDIFTSQHHVPSRSRSRSREKRLRQLPRRLLACLDQFPDCPTPLPRLLDHRAHLIVERLILFPDIDEQLPKRVERGSPA
jgi:hypothetical protein